MQQNTESLTTESILAELGRRLSTDFSFRDGHILGSMCSYPDLIVPKVFAQFLEKNIGDPGLFPATVELEREVIHTIGAFLGKGDASGSILTGGTESNIVAMWAAKRRAGRSRRQVLLPETAHFSFDKAADLMDLELVRIPVDESYRVRLDLVEAAVSERTMAIVGMAGSTGLGTVDDLEALSGLAEREGIYLHVDAAFGGFVLPFLEEAGYFSPPFGFSLSGVSSITIDPHKMGRSAIPAGCLLFRDDELARFAETNVTYLAGGETNQRTLTGTRSGASVAAVWATLKRLGREGFVENVKRAMELTHWFAGEVRDRAGLAVVVDPTMNIVGVAPRAGDLSSLAERLRASGWAVSLFDGYLRVVVMPHVTRDHLTEFLAVLEGLLKDS